jgi:hypothetical protein
MEGALVAQILETEKELEDSVPTPWSNVQKNVEIVSNS